MLIRLLSIFAMLGMMSSGYSGAESSDDEPTMGGEGFGSVMGVVAFVATILLAVVIVLAILSITGQFEADHADPAT
jgi:uncharacterized membrane protein